MMTFHISVIMREPYVARLCSHGQQVTTRNVTCSNTSSARNAVWGVANKIIEAEGWGNKPVTCERIDSKQIETRANYGRTLFQQTKETWRLCLKDTDAVPV